MQAFRRQVFSSVVARLADPGRFDELRRRLESDPRLTLDVKREPGDGYWAQIWNKAPFSASYWVGRPTQDQQYSTAYLSTAKWNETRFLRPDFDKLVNAARAELDNDKRKAMYRDMAVMVRDEGGAIIPVYNDWIDAVSNSVGGYEPHPAGELMGGMALSACWLTA